MSLGLQGLAGLVVSGLGLPGNKEGGLWLGLAGMSFSGLGLPGIDRGGRAGRDWLGWLLLVLACQETKRGGGWPLLVLACLGLIEGGGAGWDWKGVGSIAIDWLLLRIQLLRLAGLVVSGLGLPGNKEGGLWLGLAELSFAGLGLPGIDRGGRAGRDWLGWLLLAGIGWADFDEFNHRGWHRLGSIEGGWDWLDWPSLGRVVWEGIGWTGRIKEGGWARYQLLRGRVGSDWLGLEGLEIMYGVWLWK
ncbi:hypothetical protein PPACK8108_LOCUS3417 [Phakopsora pachyrhizi]|uniref:Uncharacterized protein n=1 Tax=Phakopsora pachyrhizi TaxID=170000 RepID=A0AAV0AJY0_PHAPC|nr:hypothetical protein PPACK8108_LOCUS3417 [Phakopsora pachyrhizi]